MPEATTYVSPEHISMHDAPAGDINLDDLFPNPELETAATSQPATETPSTPSAPQAPAATHDEFFLKTPTGTVYKTAEDAIRGTVEKDTLIERLRQDAIARTGIDPVTGRSIAPTASQTPPVQTETNYAANPDKYYDDLSDAVEKARTTGDRRLYAQVQQKFFNDMASPLYPLLTDVSRSRAVEAVSSEIPDFRSFQSGESYKETLSKMPLLKEAITQAEGNLQMAQNLPELYRYAYYISQGQRVPELVRTATAQTTPPPQPVRQTTTPSTMAPPAPAAPADMRTPEGRTQYLKDMESKGILDVKW